MRSGWAATILATVHGDHRYCAHDRGRLARRSWRVVLSTSSPASRCSFRPGSYSAAGSSAHGSMSGLFILTAIWGFAESRGNAWAMVPWLVAPLVILVWTLLGDADARAARDRRWSAAWGGIVLRYVFVAASFGILGTTGGTAIAALPAQSSPGIADPRVCATGADWPAYGGTNAAWRFSPLTQITPRNVGKLTKGVGGSHRWPAHQPRLREALRDREHAAEGRQLLYTCTAKNVIVALDARPESRCGGLTRR